MKILQYNYKLYTISIHEIQRSINLYNFLQNVFMYIWNLSQREVNECSVFLSSFKQKYNFKWKFLLEII